MAAPKGNQFWKARSSHGRKPIFSNPDDLMDACQQYFQWVLDNPLEEEKVFVHQGQVTRVTVPKMRAMTVAGLCIFIGVDRLTWSAYRERKGLAPVTREVDEIIREQKFTGAAADMLNANIIARDLGLSDKQEHTGKDGGPIRSEDVTNDAEHFARRMAILAARSSGAGTGDDAPGDEGGA